MSNPSETHLLFTLFTTQIVGRHEDYTVSLCGPEEWPVSGVTLNIPTFQPSTEVLHADTRAIKRHRREEIDLSDGLL